jgi:hypothetical protein
MMTTNGVFFALASFACALAAAFTLRHAILCPRHPRRWFDVYAGVVLAYVGFVYLLAALVMFGVIGAISALRNGLLTAVGVFFLATLHAAPYIAEYLAARHGDGHGCR